MHHFRDQCRFLHLCTMGTRTIFNFYEEICGCPVLGFCAFSYCMLLSVCCCTAAKSLWMKCWVLGRFLEHGGCSACLSIITISYANIYSVNQSEYISLLYSHRIWSFNLQTCCKTNSHNSSTGQPASKY